MALIATKLFVLALAVVIGLAAGSPLRAEPQPAEIPARPGPAMFPDGQGHDFGKVTHGMVVRRSLRIVNTSKVPLKFISLRGH